MTYNEIMEFLYGQSPCHEIAELSPEDRQAWQVIRFFCDRKGFRWWWESCEEEIQDEMFNDLRELLRQDRERG